jgi:hypothetical protein
MKLFLACAGAFAKGSRGMIFDRVPVPSLASIELTLFRTADFP